MVAAAAETAAAETDQKQLEPLECLRSEILVIHIRSQVKTRQNQSYKVYKIAKSSNLKILQYILHAIYLLKLLDKMYKYDLDPTRTVGATEWTQDAG